MKDMAKHPWLLERKEKDGTHRFYLRAKVPVDLIGIMGKKEIKRSLKTGDRKEARQRIDIEAAKLKQEFSDARRKLNNQPQNIADLSETDLQRMVLLWFHRAERQSARENFHTLTAQEFDAISDSLNHTDAVLGEPNDPTTQASVQAQADAILIDAGWSSEDHCIGSYRVGTSANVDKANPQYHRLCELAHRAMLERVRRDQSKLRGEAVGTAYDPIFASVTAATPPESLAADDASPPISDILDKWISERQPPEKTAREWRTAVRRFNEVTGSNLAVASITRGHVREYKDALLKLPGVLTHKLRELTMPEIIATTEDSDAQRLSPQAVKKQIAAISTLLSWAESNGHREDNPASGITAATAKNAPRPRLPYSVDDMRPNLNSLPQFRERQPSRFWVPILALYTGARMNELGQLELADVRERDGIAYIDISAEGDGKSLKTKSSVREVPIHPELVRIGFLDFLAQRRKKGGKVFFPDLKPDSIGNLTGNLSKWYGWHVRKLGITDPRKVFHSFRHTFKDACRAARITEEVHDALTGHSGGGVGRTYGGGVPLDVKADEIAKITYDGLDHSNL
jgi:integrase